MILRLLLAAALIGVGVSAFGWANGQTPAPTPSAAASPSLPKPLRLAPYKERLAKAKSVEVQTDILGIGIDSSLVAAHTTFDSLGDAAHRPKEKVDDVEADEREHKVLEKDLVAVDLRYPDRLVVRLTPDASRETSGAPLSVTAGDTAVGRP